MKAKNILFQSLAIAMLCFSILACGSSSATQPPSIQVNPIVSIGAPSNTPAPTGIPASTETIALTNTSSPTDTPAPSDTPLSPTETPNPNLIVAGTYLVGKDIQPGIYKGDAGTANTCYWERLKDLSNNIDSILANANSIGQYYVEVLKSDFAFKTECDMNLLNPFPQHTGEYPDTIQPGMYIVGLDIQPGTYKGQAGSDVSNSCYWERMKNVSGGFDAIISNDNATGQFYVQVAKTDFALNTACVLQRVGN